MAGSTENDPGRSTLLLHHRASCPSCASTPLRAHATEPITGPTAPSSGPTRAPAPGELIDRYLVLGSLGRGGMGEVVRAYDPALKREVAVKVVRLAGVSADQAQARLVREAQALARLSHPNVITVHDVGTRGDEVFVAMELVEGETLRHWLERKPPAARVLEVFRAAGAGLAAAHAAGLVHRDFKPENVMVGTDGRVRVLDFGLARELGGEPEAAAADADTLPDPDAGARGSAGSGSGGSGSKGAALTATGAWLGTPRYMAPEQWRREPADARSDQFSFCVALHEALAGSPPFTHEAVAAAATEPASLAPPRLPAGIPDGERVSQVIRRGLAAAPGERHASMAELLAALAPPRRRSRAVLVAGLAAAAVLGLGLGAWQSQRSAAIDPCANAAARVDEETWSPAARARVDAAFTAAGIASPDAARRLGAAIDRRAGELRTRLAATCRAARVTGTESVALMDLRMRCLERRRGELGGFVSRLGEASDRKLLFAALANVEGLPSASACDDGEALLRQVPPPDDPKVRARVASIEARLDRWNGRRDLDRPEPVLEELAALWPDVQALGHAPLEAQALLLRGGLEFDAGKYDAAAETLRAAARQAARSRDDHTLARAWVRLVDLESHRSGHPQALALEPVALAAIDRLGGAVELETGVDQAMGWVLRELGRYDDATGRYRRAIDRLAPAGDSLVLAQLESGLGVVAKEQGHYDDAVAAYERAIAISTRVVGTDHPLTATFQNNLAVTLRRQGKLEAAIAAFERVRAINLRTLPPEHPDQAIVLANMGSLYQEHGKRAEARKLLLEARAIWAKAYGEEHMYVAMVTMDLASCSWGEGKLDEALPLVQKALVTMEKVAGPDGVQLAHGHRDAAELLLALGRPAEALAHSTKALQIFAAKKGEPRSMAKIEFTHGRVLWAAQGDRREAVRVIRSAREKYAALGEPSKTMLGEADAWLAKHAR